MNSMLGCAPAFGFFAISVRNLGKLPYQDGHADLLPSDDPRADANGQHFVSLITIFFSELLAELNSHALCLA
jgi:hypothetical protein